MHSDMILRESLVKSTKILAGKNVKVLMEGFSPRVAYDPRTKQPTEIVLPMVPDNCPKPLVDAIKGFQDHEAAHVLYSSNEDICDSSKGSTWHFLHNVVDDNHINHRMGTDFPGTHIELKNAYKYLFDNMEQYKPAHIEKMFATNKKQATAGYIVSWVARKMNSDFTEEWYDASPLPKLMKHLDDDLSPELAKKLANCKTPADVRELTDDLQVFLEDIKEELKKMAEQSDKSKGKGEDKTKPKPKDKSKPKKDKGDKSEDKEKGDGEKSDEKGDEEEEGEGSGESDGEEEDDGDEKETKGKPSGGDKKGKPSKDETPYDEDAPPIDTKDLPGGFEDSLAGVIGQNIELSFKNQPGSFFWSDRMNELLTVDNYKGNDRASRYGGSTSGSINLTNTDGLEAFDTSCKQVSSYLRKKLERLMESRKRVYRTGGHKSGRIHAKQLFSVPLGNQHVFTQKNDIRAVNACVGLLMDLSGSMGGSKVKLAAQSTYTLADCLDRLKIPFEALGFWTDQGTTINPTELARAWQEFAKGADAKTLTKVVNRTSVNSTFIFKEFGESFGLRQKASLMAASKGQIGMYSNEDATHLRIALERLSKQKYEKKVLFVFSDGSPAFGGDCNNSRTKLKELADNAMREYGVTVVGIGIESTNVKMFYKNSQVITNLDELPAKVFEILTAQLLARN
jgi:cobaltochelatase CobT